MKELLTRQTLIRNVRRCWQRFPVSIVFTTLLTLYCLYLTWTPTPLSAKIQFIIGYYLSVGLVLSFVLQLWGEEVKHKRIVTAVQIGIHTLLVIDCAYLFTQTEPLGTLESLLVHASVLTALGLSTFIVPFFRERDDTVSWNFTHQLIGYALKAVFIGFVMTGGLSLLLASFNALFGVNVSSELYLSVATLCNLTLPLLLILGLTPEGTQKHDRTIYASKLQNKIIRYLLLPLLGCYLVVLYSYALMILVEMELPDGWISKLVVALMTGCLCLESGFHPYINKENHLFEQRITCWLPIVIIPLLVLMSIAIGRRISDYGITVSRLYLLVLNVWFYMVCIGLFIGRARRIHWIPVSFATLFLLTSALPVNITSITRSVLRKEVKTFFASHHQEKLPLSESDYKNWLDSLPKEEAERIGSLLNYLHHKLDDQDIENYVKTKEKWFNYQRIFKSGPTQTYYNTVSNETIIPVPQGYPQMRTFGLHPSDVKIEADTLTFSFHINDSVSRNIHISVGMLKKLHDTNWMQPQTIYSDTDYHIVLNRYNLTIDQTGEAKTSKKAVSFNGDVYLFMKQQ